MSNYYSHVSISKFDQAASYKAHLARRRTTFKIPNYLDSVEDIESELDADIDIVERKPGLRKVIPFHRPENDFDPFDPDPAMMAVA